MENGGSGIEDLASYYQQFGIVLLNIVLLRWQFKATLGIANPDV
jgi:hypothetical protein